MKCDDSCLTCNDASSKNCESCPETTFLYEGVCLKNCPENTYKNFNLRACSFCHHSCQSCLGPEKYDCTSCENKTRYFSNVTFNSTFSNYTGSCLCNHSFYDDSSSIYCFGNFNFTLIWKK